jgi:hypothetical protein
MHYISKLIITVYLFLHGLMLWQFESEMWLSQRWLWTILSCGTQRSVVHWKSTGVVEEHVASCFIMFSCVTYFTVLKKEEAYSSQTLVVFQWNTLRYIPKGRNLCKIHDSPIVGSTCSNRKQLSCKFLCLIVPVCRKSSRLALQWPLRPVCQMGLQNNSHFFFVVSILQTSYTDRIKFSAKFVIVLTCFLRIPFGSL